MKDASRRFPTGRRIATVRSGLRMSAAHRGEVAEPASGRGRLVRPGTLSVGAAVVAALWGAHGFAQVAPAQGANAPAAQGTNAAAADTGEAAVLQEVVVTGTTIKNQTVLTSSSDIIPISAETLAVRAPRSTDNILRQIPGMFVEDTAGAVSNNYSVRGLPGGGNDFVNFEEDGLPIAYAGTGNPDELFSYDINVQRVEVVLGGDSNVLTPNAAGASVNFITRKPDFDKTDAIVRLSLTTYNERRVDMYYSAPITSDWAFNLGGYVDSTHGTRDAGITYDSYHLKGELERRFDNGGYVILSGKVGLQHDPYYADMPYNFTNGVISSVPGTDGLTTNIASPAFSNIGVPDSCYAASTPNGCYRYFSLQRGIEAGTHQIRVDFSMPLNDSVDVFAKAQYLRFEWDFNGIFPGSGSGAAGLDTANNYLNGGANSPIAGMLTAGAVAYPGAIFAFHDLTTGQMLPATDPAALNALNGNGLMQQTVLNRQDIWGGDFASNVGAHWRVQHGAFDNSLTTGVMFFTDSRSNDQSAVATVINGVAPQSDIYDVVALNSAGQIVGALTDHGLVNYGDWGVGIWHEHLDSLSGYLNDELQFGKHLHIDLGVRAERLNDHSYAGNAASAAAPVPVGGSILLPVPYGNEFNGTYTAGSVSHGKTAKSIGVNYTFDNNFAVYGQYEFGFQQDLSGGSPANSPTSVELYEVGARYGSSAVFATAGLFQTTLGNQTTGCFDPANPNYSCNAFYDVTSRGVEYQFNVSPLALFNGDNHALQLKWYGVMQNPKLTNAAAIEYNNGVVAIPLQSFPEYNGNQDDRTPKSLQTLEAAVMLPRDLGQVYVRGQYQGSFYMDVANQVHIPGYWTVGAGIIWNATLHLTLNLSGENLLNQIGLTEGNPRQGIFNQEVVNGTFYGRSVSGRNVMLMVNYSFED